MTTLNIRRLSDATLAKYRAIVANGGTLTKRQQNALDGHELITNERVVEPLLRSGGGEKCWTCERGEVGCVPCLYGHEVRHD